MRNEYAQCLPNDVIALACALASNAEAFKAASRENRGEFVILVDPLPVIARQAVALERQLHEAMREPTP